MRLKHLVFKCEPNNIVIYYVYAGNEHSHVLNPCDLDAFEYRGLIYDLLLCRDADVEVNLGFISEATTGDSNLFVIVFNIA